MNEIKFDISQAANADWRSLYAEISTGLKRFCSEIGATPVPVIDTYQAIDNMGKYSQFGSFGEFLQQSGLPLAYEKIRGMLENRVAESEEIARIRFPSAREHFPVIRVSGFSATKEAPYGINFNNFCIEQGKIERLLEQYSGM